ncbi:hypothetical protein LBMAG56_24530 [Verrucomicrobiota bacterium]|nr:hypothetical protein LBMAG56_24530 [Verrucomicrobiota bacterium]
MPSIPSVEITEPAWDNWEYALPTAFNVAWQLNGVPGPVDLEITKPGGSVARFPRETGNSKFLIVEGWPAGDYRVQVRAASGAISAPRPFTFGTQNIQYHPGFGSIALTPPGTTFRPNTIITAKYTTQAWLGEILVEVRPQGGGQPVFTKTEPANPARSFRTWASGACPITLDSRFSTGKHYEIKVSFTYREGGVPQVASSTIGFYLSR